jgi:hypothetical protein
MVSAEAAEVAREIEKTGKTLQTYDDFPSSSGPFHGVGRHR